VFLLGRPGGGQVEAFLASQRGAAFSYPDVGATRLAAPAGYHLDHNRARLGKGAVTFRTATDALEHWRMASLGWSSVVPPTAPIEPGVTVAVLVHHYGFWSLNACRIVYRLDEAASGVRRVGFAYGTLPEHGAVGEERFTVEWHEADDSVWYDLYAFSRPGSLLAWLGYPLGRRLQRRFARASMRAMARAIPIDRDHHAVA
jgi:uncharacterized protein (UPF0548 family)